MMQEGFRIVDEIDAPQSNSRLRSPCPQEHFEELDNTSVIIDCSEYNEKSEAAFIQIFNMTGEHRSLVCDKLVAEHVKSVKRNSLGTTVRRWPNMTIN